MNIICFIKEDLVVLVTSFFNMNSLPELMQGLAGAIITIQISFAVGILIESYQRRGEVNGSLDLRVFLDEVWKFKLTLIATLIAFITPFFLVYESIASDFIFFLIWVASIIILTKSLIRLYNGVKNTGNEFKLKYFSRKKDKTDTQESWRSLWSGKSDNRFEDKDYFDHFSSDIDNYLASDNQEDVRFAGRLLNDFHDFIDNRDSIFLLSFDNCFPKILEWHFIIWKNQYGVFSKENLNKIDKSSYFEIDYIVDNIIRKITSEALSNNQRSFSYFKHLKNHFDKYSTEIIEGDKHQYVYLETVPIYQDIFEKIPESHESHDIWGHYFPKEWKVTKKNFENHIESRIFFKSFLNWVQSRIWGNNEEVWDKILDDISRELFPSTDPMMWSRIITFVFSPWSESRMKNIVERGRNFGYVGRGVVVGWGNEDVSKKLNDLTRESEESSFELALFFFGNVFSKGSVEQWILELENLDCIEDSEHYSEKVIWLEILKKLLILINKK